jgi:hypothetical protein
MFAEKHAVAAPMLIVGPQLQISVVGSLCLVPVPLAGNG